MILKRKHIHISMVLGFEKRQERKVNYPKEVKNTRAHSAGAAKRWLLLARLGMPLSWVVSLMEMAHNAAITELIGEE